MAAQTAPARPALSFQPPCTLFPRRLALIDLDVFTFFSPPPWPRPGLRLASGRSLSRQSELAEGGACQKANGHVDARVNSWLQNTSAEIDVVVLY